MRKITLVLILLIAFLLTSCSDAGVSNAGSDAPQSSPGDISTSPATIPEKKVEEPISLAPSIPEPEASSTPTTPESQIPAAPTSSKPEASPEPSPELKKMSASSSGIVDGVISDKYGMRGKQQTNGTPTLSLPLTITDAPDGTVCYAVMMLDPDSVSLCGYEWVHWLAAGIPSAEIAENASIDNAANMVQGKNDFGTTGYGGPTPPDKPHTYKITVYALDAELDLKNGFSKDQLLSAIEGHVLAETAIEGKYSN